MNQPDDVNLAPAEMVSRVVHLHSRRVERAKGMQHLQHLVPAVTLLATGLQGLRAGAEGLELALTLLEIGTGTALAVAIVRSIRAMKSSTSANHGGHHGVGWIDIFAAAVIFTEALEKWVAHHHIARPLILLGTVTLAIGFSHGWLQRRALRRRALSVSDAGVEIGAGKFRPRFLAGWDEIAAIEIDDQEARIIRTDGGVRRLDLADLRNAEEVRALLSAAQQRVAPALPVR